MPNFNSKSSIKNQREAAGRCVRFVHAMFLVASAFFLLSGPSTSLESSLLSVSVVVYLQGKIPTSEIARLKAVW